MNKKHVIGYTVTALLAMTIGAAGAAGSSAAPASVVTVTAPAPEPVTVTQAPAECGTALDFASEFMKDVGAEHTALGDAFVKAGQDGDMLTMASTVTGVEKTLNDQMTTMTSPMVAAAQVCRAAIK
jgi:hypothetical protein